MLEEIKLLEKLIQREPFPASPTAAETLLVRELLSLDGRCKLPRPLPEIPESSLVGLVHRRYAPHLPESRMSGPHHALRVLRAIRAALESLEQPADEEDAALLLRLQAAQKYETLKRQRRAALSTLGYEIRSALDGETNFGPSPFMGGYLDDLITLHGLSTQEADHFRFLVSAASDLDHARAVAKAVDAYAAPREPRTVPVINPNWLRRRDDPLYEDMPNTPIRAPATPTLPDPADTTEHPTPERPA